MKKIYVASNNSHKLKEIMEILEPLNYQVIEASSLKELEVEETGKTYYANALLKANAYLDYTDEWILSDDSGIEIEAFDNEPGIYSSRFLGEDTPYFDKNNIILDRLKNVSDRRARYICCLVLKNHQVEKSFKGVLEGEIAYKQSGNNGFGYDPIFLVNDNQSLAELSDVQKGLCSHRSLALNKLSDYLRSLDEN